MYVVAFLDITSWSVISFAVLQVFWLIRAVIDPAPNCVMRGVQGWDRWRKNIPHRALRYKSVVDDTRARIHSFVCKCTWYIRGANQTDMS